MRLRTPQFGYICIDREFVLQILMYLQAHESIEVQPRNNKVKSKGTVNF